MRFKTEAGYRVDRARELYTLWLNHRFMNDKLPTKEDRAQAWTAAKESAGATDADFKDPQYY
jgi:hypothetical protein